MAIATKRRNCDYRKKLPATTENWLKQLQTTANQGSTKAWLASKPEIID